MRPFICLFTCLFWCVSCVEYTPKPRGYYRIEPASARYRPLAAEGLAYAFDVSQAVVVELPPVEQPAGWINLSYPSLRAKIYCNYFPVTPATLARAAQESRSLVARQAKGAVAVSEKTYSDPSSRVYGFLFLCDGDSPSPVQFYLTDSTSRFFRGALYYDCKPNADSLAPVTDYIRRDIMELIQTFRWNE